MFKVGQRKLMWLPGGLLLGVCLAQPPSLSAASPTEQVKVTVKRVIGILRDSRLQGEGKKQERRERLRQAVIARFDFAEMAKRSLGNHWRRYESRHREFVAAFTDFVENAYVSQLESYKNEKILYLRERLDQGFAEVDTKVVLSKGDEIPINYRLHSADGDWKVYDVLIENVSLVNNYRSQFHRILSTSSLDNLLRLLREKKADREARAFPAAAMSS